MGQREKMERAILDAQARAKALRPSRRQPAFDNPDAIPIPRIVCPKCPAVCTVHYFKAPPKDRSWEGIEIWLECHGEHFYGNIKTELVTVDYKRSVLLEDVSIWTPDQIDQHFQKAERQMIEATERVEHLQRVMARKPPGSGE